MEAAAVVAAFEGAVSLANTLLPLIDQFRKDGQITSEQQASLLAKVSELRTGAMFEQPHWRTQP